MSFKPSLVPRVPAPRAEVVRQRIKAVKTAVLECRCGCREAIETKTGVLLKDGKPIGGTTELLCAACLMRGERVVLR